MLRRTADPATHLGARVEVEAGGRAWWRTVSTNASYCSASDPPRVHFGIGSLDEGDRASVNWLDGAREAFGPFAAGRVHRLERGRGRAER